MGNNLVKSTIFIYNQAGIPIINEEYEDVDTDDISARELQLARNLARESGQKLENVTISIGNSGKKKFYELAAKSCTDFELNRNRKLNINQYIERATRASELAFALSRDPAALPEAFKTSPDLKRLHDLAESFPLECAEQRDVPLTLLQNMVDLIGAIQTCRTNAKECKPQEIRSSYLKTLSGANQLQNTSFFATSLFAPYLLEQAAFLPSGEAASSLRLAALFSLWLDPVPLKDAWEYRRNPLDRDLSDSSDNLLNGETKIRSAIHQFRKELWADGGITPWEKSFIESLSAVTAPHFESSTMLQGPLSMMLYYDAVKGNPLYDHLITIKDINGAGLTFLVNHGHGITPEEEQNILRGKLRNDAIKLIEEGIQKKAAFEIVETQKNPTSTFFHKLICEQHLAQECRNIDFPDQANTLLDQHYRLIDLTKERAQPGDLIAYVGVIPETNIGQSANKKLIPSLKVQTKDGKSLNFDLKTLSVVETVNGQGYPVKALHYGDTNKVRRHPTQVRMDSGMIVGVFRKNPAKADSGKK